MFVARIVQGQDHMVRFLTRIWESEDTDTIILVIIMVTGWFWLRKHP